MVLWIIRAWLEVVLSISRAVHNIMWWVTLFAFTNADTQGRCSSWMDILCFKLQTTSRVSGLYLRYVQLIVFQTFVVAWPGNLELHLAHQHMVTGLKLPETTHHSGMQLHVIWSVSCNQEGRHLLQANRTKLKEEPQVYKANKWWMPLRNAKVSAPIWYQCKMAIRLFPE